MSNTNVYTFPNKNKNFVTITGTTYTMPANQVYAPNTIYYFSNTGVSNAIVLPTAAALVAAQEAYYGVVNVGDIWKINFYQAGAGIPIYIDAGSGGTPTTSIQGNNGQAVKVLIMITNVTSGSQAYNYTVSPGL